MTGTGIVDRYGRPIKSTDRPNLLMGTLNENAHHWTRYQPEVYYNPDSISLETYEKMYNTDETVFSGIEFLIMAALSRFGEYTNESNKKHEEFVRRQLVELPGNFSAKLADIMTAAPFGFSLTEIIWKVKGREIGLADLQTLPPATIHLDLHRSGPLKNRPRAAYQFFRRDKQVQIPLQKAILYSHGTSFGNAYGVSRLKRAYKSWFIKDLILKSWALCCERYGSPFAVGKVKGSGNSYKIGGVTVDAISHMENVLDSMVGGKGSAVIGIDDAIDLTYAGTGYGDDFEGLVAYCNKMIYRALGLPSLIADHGNTGSYSLGKQHFQLFILVLEKLLFEVIDTVIEQLVRPLIELNFGPQEDYGTFSVEEFEPEDAKTLAETAEILARSGVCNFQNLEDVNHWRERIGLPLMQEEDLESSAPPEIPGMELQEPPEQSTDVVDGQSIAEELRERRQTDVLNFSARARTNAHRERRRRMSSRASVDRMSERLAKYARPA